MRILERNKRTIYYMLYQGKTPVSEEGLESGESAVCYYPAVSMRVNVSPATGYAQTEQFGNLANYDKVIVTDDMTCPIDENSVLFIDKEPEYDSVTGTPLYDYTVRRVAKSLYSISIAVSKVTIS